MEKTIESVPAKITLNKAFLMYGLVSLFLIFEMAVQVSPSVMSRELMKDLNVGPLGLGLMSGCYFYTYSAMQIPSGILFDKFNPRILITASLAVCAIGCLLLGLAHSYILGSLARLLMGIGSAFAFIGVLVITKDLFEKRYFSIMTGITQMLAALGAMSGQLPVSKLIEIFGWRQTLLIFSGIGGLIAIGTYIFVRYNASDYRIKTKDRNALNTLKPVLKKKQNWYIALYACFLWAPMSGFASLWGIPFLTSVDNISPAHASFLLSLMWVGLAIGSPIVGYLSVFFNKIKILLVSTALIGLLSFGIILLLKMNSFLLASMLILSGAACAGQALSFTLIKDINSTHTAATAISFNNIAVVISGAIFQPLIGLILQKSSIGHISDYRLAVSVIFICYCLSFIISSFFILRKKSSYEQTIAVNQ